MVQDARQRTKVYLDAKLTAGNITKDDGTTGARFLVMYEKPNYPMEREFRSVSATYMVDLVFLVGEPTSEPMIDSDQTAYGYTEKVPIIAVCIDKTGITGTKLLWKATAELRLVLQDYPFGSYRSLEVMTSEDEPLGSTILYTKRHVLNYERDLT